jgi:hypothetical protein
MALTDTVTSLAHEVGDTVVSIAHEVANKAQDAAAVAGERGREWGQVAGERGKELGRQAVDAGRSTLQSKGVIIRPSHKGRNLLVLVVLAVVGYVAWKAASGRKAAQRSASSPEAERIADKNHVKVA